MLGSELYVAAPALHVPPIADHTVALKLPDQHPRTMPLYVKLEYEVAFDGYVPAIPIPLSMAYGFPVGYAALKSVTKFRSVVSEHVFPAEEQTLEQEVKCCPEIAT